MTYKQKYLKYKYKYLQRAGAMLKSDFDIQGPKGTFGQWFFSSSNPTIATKKSLKKKNKIKINKEAEVYQEVNSIIKLLDISIIHTLEPIKKDDIHIYPRLYPIENHDTLIELDYSTNFIGDTTNSWKTFNPDEIKESNLLSDKLVDQIIPYELGQIWMGMLIIHKKALWEPEIILASSGDKRENKVLLIDFDKTYNTSDDCKYFSITNVDIPVYHVLTNIFPSPNTPQYVYFKLGLKHVSEKYEKLDLFDFISSGFESLM